LRLDLVFAGTFSKNFENPIDLKTITDTNYPRQVFFMKLRYFWLSLITALLVLSGCGKSASDDGSAALALLNGGGSGNGSTKAQATPEAAASGATTGALAYSIQNGMAFRAPLRNMQLALLRPRSWSPESPFLTPTALSYNSGTCTAGATGTSCTNAYIVGSTTCQGGGTMQITGAGLFMNTTLTGPSPSYTMQSTMQLQGGASIVYSNCTVTYSDPVARTAVTATLTGTITALNSSDTFVYIVTGSTLNFTITGSDSMTVSNLVVNGTTINGAHTTATALNGTSTQSMTGTWPNIAGTVTMSYGPASTFKIDGVTRLDLSNLSVTYNVSCNESGCN
jgi:hypothetical protein